MTFYKKQERTEQSSAR